MLFQLQLTDVDSTFIDGWLYDVTLWSNLNVVSTRIQRWIMVDKIGNQISTLFQRQKCSIDPICIFNLFQHLSNIWEFVSDVDSTLDQLHFARWVANNIQFM